MVKQTTILFKNLFFYIFNIYKFKMSVHADTELPVINVFPFHTISNRDEDIMSRGPYYKVRDLDGEAVSLYQAKIWHGHNGEYMKPHKYHLRDDRICLLDCMIL
jgi:hypothetical protein